MASTLSRSLRECIGITIRFLTCLRASQSVRNPGFEPRWMATSRSGHHRLGLVVHLLLIVKRTVVSWWWYEKYESGMSKAAARRQRLRRQIQTARCCKRARSRLFYQPHSLCLFSARRCSQCLHAQPMHKYSSEDSVIAPNVAMRVLRPVLSCVLGNTAEGGSPWWR